MRTFHFQRNLTCFLYPQITISKWSSFHSRPSDIKAIKCTVLWLLFNKADSYVFSTGSKIRYEIYAHYLQIGYTWRVLWLLHIYDHPDINVKLKITLVKSKLLKIQKNDISSVISKEWTTSDPQRGKIIDI